LRFYNGRACGRYTDLALAALNPQRFNRPGLPVTNRSNRGAAQRYAVFTFERWTCLAQDISTNKKLLSGDRYDGLSRCILVDDYDGEPVAAAQDRVGCEIQTSGVVVDGYTLAPLSLRECEHAVVFRPRRVRPMFVIADG